MAAELKYSVEELENELQSLIRVRNRLAMSDDRQLPKILVNLLPRLLAKFDRINTTYVKNENERLIVDQNICQCTGIFSHAMDRIRLVRTGEFCHALLAEVASFQSTATTTMAITLLQTGLPFCAVGPDSKDGFDLSSAAKLVHETHQQLLTSNNTNTAESRHSFGAAPTAAQLLYRMSGWMLVDCIAVTASISPSMACSAGRDKTMNSWEMLNQLPTQASPFDLSLDGVFHFVLDVLLYWPTSSSLTVHDARNNADITVPDNSTGLSTEGLQRMQCRNAWSSNERLRQLKLVTLNYALVPYSQTMVTAGNLHDSIMTFELPDLRRRVLAVLFEDDRFPHGRVARQYTSRLRSRGMDDQSRGCSFPLTIYLLFLVLGERAARDVLIQAQSDFWEPIVGKPPAGDVPGLLRGPLPLHVAERVVKYIRDGFQLLPQHFPTGRLDADAVKQLQVVVNLVVEIQHTSNDGVFWGIQLMHKLYSEMRCWFPIEQTKDDEDFRRIFYRKCLDVCKLVLAVLPDHVDVRLRRRTSNRVVGRENQMDEMEDHQGHFETIVSNHRKLQKNRMLCGSDAASSRRLAYEMISEIVLDPMYDVGATRDFCLAVFNWVPCEEDESNDAPKTKALSSLFQVILLDVPEAASTARVEIIYSLIPHLLAAACCESPNARLVAIEWSSKLVATIEPDVAMLICSHLSYDEKDVVSKKSRRATDALRLTSMVTPDVSTDQATTCLDTRLPECRATIANQLFSWLEQIQGEFGLELDAALPVLADHSYSLQKALESLRSDFAGTLHNSGLGFRNAANGEPHDHECLPASPLECGICFEEMEVLESFALRCRHAFCRSCWVAYLSEQLKMISSASRLTCPNHKCQERVLMSDVSKIHEPLVAPWQDAILTTLIDKCDLYSSCPGPDCAMVASRRKHAPRSDPVHCSLCSASYCFGCRQEPHKPAECSELEQWNQIYSSSKFWIQTNTKPCPACKVPIEKNNGCNHMHCTLCGVHFCWLCLSDLRLHMEAHSCNTYNPMESADNDDERRAIFFTERFGSHWEGEHYCRKRLTHYESERESVVDRHWYLSGDQLNDVCDALDDIADARRFLQYSYVSAWSRSMRRDPDVARFTQLQAALENITERLSTLTLAANFESIYHEHRLGSHFRTMSFLQEALHIFMKRMQVEVSLPASNL